MIRFDIITLFPNLFTEHLNNLPFKKAVSKKLAQYNFWDLRNYSPNKHGTVDDKPYGGGTGMILMVEPIYKALNEIKNKEKIILLSPRGKRYNQEIAQELAKSNRITLICGRYEGVDNRVEENLVTDVISIGDFVLSGGELPALTIMESITRLLPGVLDKEDATKIESFSNKFIEFPQYTRPENFNKMKVPEILLSGNHEKIEKWRRENSTPIE